MRLVRVAAFRIFEENFAIMIKELTINNFRSIREGTLELGKFTVLNGANNSGKSSVLYALQVLKNVVTNPNRSVDELLNLGFLNLGGLESASYLQKVKDLRVMISVSQEEIEINYGASLREKWNYLLIRGVEPYKFNEVISVSFPYALNKTVPIKLDNERFSLMWNGIQPTNIEINSSTRQPRRKEHAIDKISNLIVAPINSLYASDIIPTHRGFTKPIFNQIPLNGSIQTEDEVATHLAIDKTLQSKVSHYFEKITGKRFSVSMSPGVGFFYLQVREPDTPFTTELVNQGMGTNQILFLLAKILYDKNRLICIDEPEIHLHPALIERFMQVLVEISEKEDKQFIFSTHSEHLLMSLLAEVYEEKLAANDLKVYFLQKEGAETTIEPQEVQPNGQINGGLKNFLGTQMRLAQRFFPTEANV